MDFGPDGETIYDLPRFRPMLASPAEKPFDDPGWQFEVKWDGYRCLAYLAAERCYLDSRNRKPLLPQFPALSAMAEGLRAGSAVLDGEVVAFRGERVDFSHLRAHPEDAVYVAFDLLLLDGRPLLDEPLEGRVRRLRQCYEWSGRFQLSEGVRGEGSALFSWVQDRGIEGIVAKRNDSSYAPGSRSKNWIKIRNIREGSFWVVGYAPSPGRAIGSLVLAMPASQARLAATKSRTEPELTIAGRVSSGLTGDHERLLVSVLRPSASSTIAHPSRDMRDVTWVVPYFGVEVQYTEITPDGYLRHPVFREVILS